MPINENALTKGQIRKLNALRKSIGDDLAEEAFDKWLARQVPAAPPSDPVAEKIVKVLAGQDGKINFGRYGYTVRKARGKGQSDIVAVRNEKGEK